VPPQAGHLISVATSFRFGVFILAQFGWRPFDPRHVIMRN